MLMSFFADIFYRNPEATYKVKIVGSGIGPNQSIK